jgi:glycosidase
MAENTSRNLRSQVFYQIFVRNYKEGTFKAVMKDLDRIQELGADWIYLLPVHPTG